MSFLLHKFVNFWNQKHLLSTRTSSRKMFKIFNYYKIICFTRNCPSPITILGFIKINVSYIECLQKIGWNFFKFLSNRNCYLWKLSAILSNGTISIEHSSKPPMFEMQNIWLFHCYTISLLNFFKLLQTNRMSKISIHIYTKCFQPIFFYQTITNTIQSCTRFQTATIFILNINKQKVIFYMGCNF